MLAAAAREIACFDYTPQSVKLAVCGTGAAAKDQVKHMVGVLLNLPVEPPSDHAADALAVAVCHASHARDRRRPPTAAAAAVALMIAAVTGEVLSRRSDHVVIDAGGVGYHLAVSSETLRTVPAVGERVSLHAHLISRDDSLALYGFATEDERELFLSLISVSGVGPKVAMAALSRRLGRRAAARARRRRREALPGRSRDRQADRGADHRRAARAGRRRARGGGVGGHDREQRPRGGPRGPDRARLHADRGRAPARDGRGRDRRGAVASALRSGRAAA